MVVTHLTRMHGGHICIAGLDTTTNRHIRPVLGRSIESTFLTRGSSQIGIGSILHFIRMVPTPSAPEVEDRWFREEDCTIVGALTAVELRTRLQACAATGLSEIFGPLLQRNGRTWAMPAGQGEASLGVLAGAVLGAPQVDAYGRLRMTIDDGTGPANVAVTDLRLFEDDGETPNRRAILHTKLSMGGSRTLLSVGVGRAWARDGEPRGHWLQVNNIHV